MGEVGWFPQTLGLGGLSRLHGPHIQGPMTGEAQRQELGWLVQVGVLTGHCVWGMAPLPPGNSGWDLGRV